MIKTILSGYLLVSLAMAGTTGKIKGRVVDESTGSALVGANVIVVGTTLGAATDLQGAYYILQVPPGIYQLRILMMGYRDVRVTDVKVMIDHTTPLNVALPPTVLEAAEEVTVVAERKIIQADITTSTQFLGSEQIRRLPVSDTKEALMNQAGVFFDAIPVASSLNAAGGGEARYSIRGGNQDEVLWFINGTRTSSLVQGKADRGGSFTSINLNSVREVQIISGGYNAEYGNAQSGIVNVVTKEGGHEFSGSAELIYGPPGQHHFGNYMYDITDTTIKEFRDHIDTVRGFIYPNQWNLIKNNPIYSNWIIPEDTIEYIFGRPVGQLDPAWWTPYRRNQIYDYRKFPDQTLLMTIGGPLFGIGGGLATFFLSSQLKRQSYTYPMPRDTRNLENIQVNISFPFKPKFKLRIEGLYNHEGHATLQQYGDFVPQTKYYRGWGSLIDTYTSMLSLNWNHSPSTEFFYDFKLSYFQLEYIEGPSKYSMIGESKNPDIWGYQRYNVDWEDSLGIVEPFDAWAFTFDNHWITSDLSLVGSFNWQIDQANFIKTGFEYRYNTYAEKKAVRYVSYNRDPRYWFNRGLHETFHPIEFAAYIQDKMEFQSMILNFGLRYDYFNPNREWFVNEGWYNLAIDPEYDAALDYDGDQVDENSHVQFSFQNVLDKPRALVDTHHMFSPRFGVSFPITENTVLHYNYGHFYQIPALDKMFMFSYFRPETILKGMMLADSIAAVTGEEPAHATSDLGNPERVVSFTFDPLLPEKTISFEVGVKHNFRNWAVLDVTAFYKDVFNQTEELVGIFDRRIYGWNPYKGQITDTQFYTSHLPGDYGDSRGFEINLRTLFSKGFSIDLNYSFSRAVQGRASPQKVHIDDSLNVSYTWDDQVEKRIPVEKSYSRPHIFRGNIYLNYPESWQIPIISRLLHGTSASILYKYVSGQAFTYVTDNDPPDTYNNYRYPPIITTDLRVNREFRLSSYHKITAYVRITNLFNRKNLRNIGDNYHIEKVDEVQKKFIDSGEPTLVDLAGYDISQITYYEPRRFYFGLNYNLR